jgi:TonB family protein
MGCKSIATVLIVISTAFAMGENTYGIGTAASTSSSQNIRISNEEFVIPNGVVPPELVAYVPPAYTDEARRNTLTGMASFEVQFDIDGSFQILRQLNSVGFGMDESARQALQQWRFLPAQQSGRRVSVISQIDVVLNPEDQARMINQLVEAFTQRGLRTRLEMPNGTVMVVSVVRFSGSSGSVPQVKISSIR